MNIPLFVRSSYSFLEGVVTPEDWAQAAAAAGYASLALVDHNFLTAAVEFTQACQKYRLQPILGLEVDVSIPAEWSIPVASPPRLVLLAQSETGWQSLCEISSLVESLNRPITLKELAQFNAGLICLSGDTLGLASFLVRHGRPEAARNALALLQLAFPQAFYLQLSRQESGWEAVEEVLIGFARQLHIPLVVAQTAAYLEKHQVEIQRTLLAIGNLKNVNQVSAEHGYRPQALFMSPGELQDAFADRPDALSQTSVLAETCRFVLPLGIPRMPFLDLPAGVTPEQLLSEKAHQGAKEIYGEITAPIQARLDHELEVISHQGFEVIFLIVQEVLDYARTQEIQFSSRGSAASSLVAHCLHITSPDPIRLNLYFERFLNPARSTPPDIDTDIDSNRREELIHHIFERYGRKRVAMVATINRFRPRSAVADVAKAFGLSPKESHILSKEMPHSFFAARSSFHNHDFLAEQFANLAGKYRGSPYQDIFRISQAIIGLPRHLSVHPGGVVIAPGHMTQWVPVMAGGSKDILVTQFDLEALEEVGLVKLDMLGIRGLSVMSTVAQQIYTWRRKDFKNSAQVLEAIPQVDDLTSDLILNGRTIGCFQIESPGMRSTLKQIHACTPDDVMAALALFRPGPMRGGLRDAFIRRHNQLEEVTQLHPALTDILADTYGVILYQEQVLMIANQIAGLFLLTRTSCVER